MHKDPSLYLLLCRFKMAVSKNMIPEVHITESSIRITSGDTCISLYNSQDCSHPNRVPPIINRFYQPPSNRVDVFTNSVQFQIESQSHTVTVLTNIQNTCHQGPTVVQTVQCGTPPGCQPNHQVAIHMIPPPPSPTYNYGPAVAPIAESSWRASAQISELVGRLHPLYHDHRDR